MKTRIPITEEQKKLSYAKYYDKPLAKVPEEKFKYLEAPIDPSKALRIEDRNRLFEPGYLEEEIGYCKLEDGSVYVANLTPMPGVTVEMFDWWFAWHGLGELRYTIWDPEDHYYAFTTAQVQGRNKNLSMKERYYNTTHIIKEDIGGGAAHIFANFRDPKELGFNAELIGTPACGTIVTANCGVYDWPGGAAQVMCHFVRETEDGIELRTRFWTGYHIIDQKPVLMIPEGTEIPLEMARGLLAHNMLEFQNLADLLPRIYPEEKDNWA
jgi:hypothetical protein